MTKTMYIKVGDQFKNEFDNTCTIERISEPLVIYVHHERNETYAEMQVPACRQ